MIILSDFFDDAAAIFSALNPYLHRGFDVHLFHILDPAELELEDRGLVAFLDMETNERVVAHTDALKKGYRVQIAERIRQLRTLAMGRQVRYSLARTDRPFYELLDEFIK